MKTIIALIDFSDVTAKVLQQARVFGNAFQAKVVLMHVVPDQPVVIDVGLVSPTMHEAPSPEVIDSHRARLMQLRESLAGLVVEVEQLAGGGAAAVLDTSARLNADLFIVGSHHHGALFELFVGSFTGDLLKHAQRPVLVIPAVP